MKKKLKKMKKKKRIKRKKRVVKKRKNYQKKMKIIRKVKDSVQTGPLREYLPPHWQSLMDRQHQEWQPMDKKDIARIMQYFNKLREIEGFYLRNAAVSLAQGLVRATFNCDGTYIVAAEFFPQFVRDITA